MEALSVLLASGVCEKAPWFESGGVLGWKRCWFLECCWLEETTISESGMTSQHLTFLLTAYNLIRILTNDQIRKVPLRQTNAVLSNKLLLCYSLPLLYHVVFIFQFKLNTRICYTSFLQLLVMTPDILRNALRHRFLTLDIIKVLIFDECHNAKKNHAYAIIMKVY